MDEAEFDRLVARERARHKSFARVFDGLDPERQREPWLRDRIRCSETSRSTWDALAAMARLFLRERRRLPDALADWAADALEGRRPRPPRSAEDAARRKVEVWLGVLHLVCLHDLKPTRALNGLPECCAEGGTALDVIGKASGRNYKAVERDWSQRDTILRSYPPRKK